MQYDMNSVNEFFDEVFTNRFPRENFFADFLKPDVVADLKPPKKVLIISTPSNSHMSLDWLAKTFKEAGYETSLVEASDVAKWTVTPDPAIENARLTEILNRQRRGKINWGSITAPGKMSPEDFRREYLLEAKFDVHDFQTVKIDINSDAFGGYDFDLIAIDELSEMPVKEAFDERPHKTKKGPNKPYFRRGRY